ncbi:MAG: ATP-binding protein [Candidatus Magasanikbacteria bacterium]
MKIKKIQLKEFKRFDDLTIDLGDSPKKIVAIVGPNGCGKSSVFDALEDKLRDFRHLGDEGHSFYSKALYYQDEEKQKSIYNKAEAVKITLEDGVINRKSFYIRTAYRFTSKFNVTHLEAQPEILALRDEPISSIAIDTRLESNYKRLLGKAYTEFFDGAKTGDEVREALIGKVNQILNQILDIEISELGNILEKKGQLYFKKGNVENFPYSNLSSGEKEVVDIILDLIIKTEEYNETVFCIDEPELHLNTSIQRKLLLEIEKLIPDNCQLWVATHSIGFLRGLQEDLKEKSQVLDFSEKDFFTGTHTITPIIPSRNNWQRIFGTVLEDLTGLISPRKIIYCEGKDRPGQNGEEKGFDAKVFNSIFTVKYHDLVFVSSGGNTELDQRSNIAMTILTKVLNDIEILVLKDRDISSGRLNTEKDRQVYLSNNPNNYRVLKRWEIENYLYDKEVLSKYCIQNDLEFKEVDYDNFVTDIINQNVKDSTGLIKNFCSIITNVNPENFKFNLATLITEDMNIYKELEKCIM